MKKSKLKKFNQSILQKNTPLLGLTVLQLVVLFLVVNGGTVAILLSQRQQTSVQEKSTDLPTYEATNFEAKPVEAEKPQDTPQNNDITPSTAPTTSNTSTPSSLPDQYGCIPNTTGYDSCVMYAKKNELSAWCLEQSSKAGDTYNVGIDKAKAAYDKVMGEWDAVKNLPYYQRHPYEQYAADAKTKYNAISKPAYTTYVSTINSLNSK